MKKWKALGGFLAFCLAASTGLAQTTQEDIQSKLRNLEKRLASVEAENASLKSQMLDNDDAALETQVNALLERYTATTVNSAANPVTLTGEFRFRSYWQSGDADLSSSIPLSPGGKGEGTPVGSAFNDEVDGSWTDALVRLGFMYEFTGDITAYAEIQAHWSYGDEGSATFGQFSSPFSSPYGFFHGESLNDMTLHQGWIEVRNVLGRPEFTSRTGRQEIVLGNQFQFGNADWYSGWSFDGTVWTWDDESFRLVGIMARLSNLDLDLNQVPSYLSAHDDDELYAIYFTLKTIENHELDIYWIYINGHGVVNSVGSTGNNVGGGGYAAGGNAYYHTLGARIGGEFPDIADGLDWNAEAAFQFGDVNPGSATYNDVSGFAVEGEVGVVFDKDNAFRVYVRVLWAQGPDDPSTAGGGKESGYIPLYPNRHSNSGFRARYGMFDMIPLTNVLTWQVGLHFDPDPAWTLGATILWATTDESDTLVLTSDDDYGWEFDIWGEYRYSEQLIFGAGIAILLPDDEGQALWFLDDDTHVLVFVQARLIF